MFLGIKNFEYGRFLIAEDDISRVLKDSPHDYMFDGFLKKYYDKYLNKQSIAIDIGANIGTHTVYMAKKCAGVFAFEPQEYVYFHLCGNIFINNLFNVTAINLGCYDEHKMLRSAVDVNVVGKNFQAGMSFYDGATGDVEIEVVKLDDVIKEKINFIKVDAQGADLKALIGATNIINTCKPIIAFEIEDDKIISKFNNKKEDYFHFFNLMNYSCNRLTDSDYLAVPN